MRIQDLSDRTAVEKALAEFDDRGGIAFRKRYGFGPSTQYYVCHTDRLYDAKAIAGVAYGHQHPATGALANDQFDGGEAATNKVLRALGFTVLDSHAQTVEQERAWRFAVWANLVERRDDNGLLTADAVRDVGAYGNFRGIWSDLSRTKKVHPSGVTMGLKHTGQHYPDDLSETGVLYHYPVTKARGRDLAEVNATKAAAELRLPVFVIGEVGELRKVQLAWVEGWEDESSLFLVEFGEKAPERIIDRDRSDDEPFSLEGNRSRKRASSVTVRPDQARFKLEVFRRYGPRCPLSGIAVPQMIEAAHLRGDADGGSSDARNGLPMNAALHRAFDAHLFAIHPDTLAVEVRPEGPTLDELGIIHPRLDLPRPPHRDALAWRYKEWLNRTGRSV
ncbi:HNH endonuclease signature motif containing protein [Streptomyces sp. HNM0663]|uniref:HNH endonuclease signature motif containing protein n=1 Tax=Streptomyces chengmaiensis TaxID=3040919 RepID=A0ABT6HFS3_9ACTN|nr:HNH endonuclease signature motif containing protein [Streptomyces chengmaiensis]MDH2387615.1 HNH endonuclease signature motif containing protein [Streptomyces chengmaiensis]